jgi:hypothetical protein
MTVLRWLCVSSFSAKVAFCRKISEDRYQSRRLTVLKEMTPAPGSPKPFLVPLKNTLKIWTLCSAVREMGHDELLMNSLKRLSYGQCRHSSAGRAADL